MEKFPDIPEWKLYRIVEKMEEIIMKYEYKNLHIEYGMTETDLNNLGLVGWKLIFANKREGAVSGLFYMDYIFIREVE